MSGTLFAIFEALRKASAEELQSFQELRVPNVFQRCPAYNPEFHLLRRGEEKFEITFSPRARDVVALASFVVLPQFHARPGCVSVNGVAVTGATYGEEDLYYALGTDTAQKLLI
jgi:hypothetical protein